VAYAGGIAAPTDVKFTLNAEYGKLDFGVLSNPYLNGAAKVIAYTVDVVADGTIYAYEQDTTLEMVEVEGIFHHTDRSTLHRVD